MRLFGQSGGRQPANLMGQQPRFNQPTTIIPTGGFAGANRIGGQSSIKVYRNRPNTPLVTPDAPFGYKDGQPIRKLFPRSEREQQEALAEKEFREYDPAYMSNKVGMPLKMGTPLGEASFKIQRAFSKGDISASQARSLADRIIGYYGDQTQQELFESITGTGGVESSMQQPEPRPRATNSARGTYFGSQLGPEGIVETTFL